MHKYCTFCWYIILYVYVHTTVYNNTAVHNTLQCTTNILNYTQCTPYIVHTHTNTHYISTCTLHTHTHYTTCTVHYNTTCIHVWKKIVGLCQALGCRILTQYHCMVVQNEFILNISTIIKAPRMQLHQRNHNALYMCYCCALIAPS